MKRQTFTLFVTTVSRKIPLGTKRYCYGANDRQKLQSYHSVKGDVVMDIFEIKDVIAPLSGLKNLDNCSLRNGEIVAGESFGAGEAFTYLE